MKVNAPGRLNLVRKKETPGSRFWPIPDFKGRTFELWISNRWVLNFCLLSRNHWQKTNARSVLICLDQLTVDLSLKPWCLLPETKLSCEVVIKYLLSPLHRLPANSKASFVAPSSYKRFQHRSIRTWDAWGSQPKSGVKRPKWHSDLIICFWTAWLYSNTAWLSKWGHISAQNVGLHRLSHH